MKNHRILMIFTVLAALLILGLFEILKHFPTQRQSVLIGLNYLTGSKSIPKDTELEIQRFLSDEVINTASEELKRHGLKYNPSDLRRVITIDAVLDKPAVIKLEIKAPPRINMNTFREVLIESFRRIVAKRLSTELHQSNATNEAKVKELLEMKRQIEADGVDKGETNKLIAIRNELLQIYKDARDSVRGIEDGQIINVIKIENK